MQSFIGARVEHTRLDTLREFSDAVVAGSDRLATAAASATAAYFAAKGVADAARGGCEKRKVAVEQAETAVKRWEGLQSIIPKYVEPIAKAEALRDQQKGVEEERREQITVAAACAEAEEQSRKLDAELDAIQDRLKQLPLLAACWSAVAKAPAALAACEKEIAGYGDPAAKLCKAEAEQERLTIRRTELQRDHTAVEQEDVTRRAGMLEQQEKDARTALSLLHGDDQQVQSDHDALQARCPTCDQRLDAHARGKRIAHLSHWLEYELPTARQGLSRRNATLIARRKEWLKECQALEKQWEAAVSLVAQATNDQVALKAAHERYSQAESELESACKKWQTLAGDQPWDPQERQCLTAKCANIEKELSTLQADAERYKSIPRLQEELNDALARQQTHEQERARLIEEQAAVGYDKVRHEQADEALIAVRNEWGKAVEKRREAEQVEQQAASDAKRADEIASGAARDVDDFHNAVCSYRQEEQLASLLNRFHERYFRLNTEAIAQRASELIAQAVTDGSIQGIRFGHGHGHEPQYLDSSYAQQPVSRLSGGEKAVVGLCFRIAVAEQALRISQAGRLRFLILDEVLGSLDEERLEAMQAVFQTVQASGLFEHVIMITHLESVKQNWHGSRLSVQKIDAKASQAGFTGDMLEVAVAE